MLITFIRLISVFLALLAFIMVNGTMVLTFFPSKAISCLKIILPDSTFNYIDVKDVTGNPFHGYTMSGLAIKSNSFDYSSRHIIINFSFDNFFNDKVFVSSLNIIQPQVHIKSGLSPGSENSNPHKKGFLPLFVENIQIQNGSLRVSPNFDSESGSINNLNADLSYLDHKLTINSSTFSILKSTFSSHGYFVSNPIQFWIDGSASGALEGSYKINFSSYQSHALVNFKGDLSTLSTIDGNIDSHLSVNGNWPDIKWEWNTALSDVQFKTSSIKRARIDLKGSGIHPVQTTGQIDISKFTQGPMMLDHVRALLSGSTNQHNLEINIKSGDRRLFAKGKGSVHAKEWTAKWSKLNIESFEKWFTTSSFKTVVTSNSVIISNLFLKTDNSYVRLNGEINQQALIIMIDTDQFDITKFLNKGPDFNLQHALLTTDISITKTRDEFMAEGPLRFTAELISIPSYGLSLNNIFIDASGDGRVFQINKGMALGANNGTIVLKGQLERNNPDLDLNVDNLSLSLPIGLNGIVNSTLELNGSWSSPELVGHIKITEADFNPDNKRTKEESTEPTNKLPSAFKMDIDVTFDRNVWFKSGPSSIELQGDLNIRKNPYEPMRLFGHIKAIKGSYVVYGREFKMNESQITFTGNTPLNPSLNIKGTFTDELNKVRVYLFITGTKNNPEISLSSEPPLEDSDIVSFLITGQLNYQPGLNGDNNNSSQLAQNVVAGYLSEEIRQQIQNMVDLDVFRVQVTDESLTDVVVGKNLTQDLYLSYGQTLGPSGEQRVQAEYFFTDIWNLEGYTTSTGRYVIDLLFSLGFP